MSQTNIQQFLFAFIFISLKVTFKNTSIKKVLFGENFTVKRKTWDKIQNLKATKLIFVLFYFFETNFLVLQAKLVKNVLTACLLTTLITGIHWVIEHIYTLTLQKDPKMHRNVP